jgi:ABC-2 type transport system permease protein
MTLWQLEWQRLLRTRRWLALLGVYVFFGLVGPLTARYLPEIVGFAGGDLEGATIEFPPPVPADGMAQYVSNAVQIGTLVSVVVVAGAVAFDAIPEMGVFLRTRVRSVREILLPRVVVSGAAVIAAFVLGGLAAWYETWALIGAVDATDIAVGLLLGALFLAFVVALVTAVASRASSVLGTVMTSIVVLLLLPIAGLSDAVGRWLPTHLSGALAALPAGAATPGDYLAASATSVALTAGLLLAAGRMATSREL